MLRNVVGFLSIFFYYSTLAVQSASSDGVFTTFKWSASVDQHSGLAQSQEISYPSRIRGKKDQHYCEDNNDDDQANRKNKIVVQCFLDYPNWLCKGSVTLGLLRAVQGHRAAERSNGAWDVQLNGIGTSVLILGRPSRRGNVIQFPFQGGLLVAQNQGCLQFAVTDHGAIETNVVDYRPRLCGAATAFLPIHPVRAAVYRRTQTLVHAYVMWRFHRYCHSAAAAAVATTTTIAVTLPVFPPVTTKNFNQ